MTAEEIKRDQLIMKLAELVAGLHVPISMGMPLGVANAAYSETRSILNDFGWSTASDIESEMRKVLL